MLCRKAIALSAIVLTGCVYPPDRPVCVSYHYEPNMGTKQRQPHAVCDSWVTPKHNKEMDIARP